MTPAQALDKLLTDVAFAAPVTPADCAQVRDALRELLPKAIIEVYCHKDVEVVIVADGVRRVIEVAP